ncbi:Guanine nucleotide-binding protein-like 3 [Babesia duncani]|uniref:Guanine nucleotide-binding protein-like 3 n=1 Tax=Babesia duncani TaxID=323732 RepID=A0AAD9PJQ8_9APIC|nr:Guanine nucleotide-binding protein-like 3 [Babesia duncani]
MVKLKKGSKRQELAKKYNIQHMVAAHNKKIRKLAKKGELRKLSLGDLIDLGVKKRKIPEIPNCIFKREILDNLKRTKAIKDAKAIEEKDGKARK